MKLLTEPEGRVSAVTTLYFETEWQLELREVAGLSVIVLLANEAEVSSDTGECFGVSEVHTFDLVMKFFRYVN